MNELEYVKNSLELHLFFDRIMKEHAFFLDIGFMDKDREYKAIAKEFQRRFTAFLEEVIDLANGHVSEEILESGELVTKYTLEAEAKTNEFTGINLNSELTIKELNLKTGEINLDNNLISKIYSLNKRVLSLLPGLIRFQEDVLKEVLACKIFTTNYPTFIMHITNEAKMYYKLLSMIDNKEDFNTYSIYEQELFWNNIMKEHAEFIKGTLDPSEEELIDIAAAFVVEYNNLLEKGSSNPTILTTDSLKEALKVKDFEEAGTEGLLSCQVRSVIIPLLADHVVRESNHFIRFLKNAEES